MGKGRVRALEEAIRISRDRAVRPRELKNQGKKLMGYLCLYAPVELITAAGLVPFRITGSLDPVTDADTYLERLMCPFVRSSLDLALKKRFDFVDGMIWPHSCDNIQKTFDIWKHYVPHEFFHYLDVPHMTDDSSLLFFLEEIEALKAALERYTGVEITRQRLTQSIRSHNKNRSLLREISGLRRGNPPLLRGSEMMQIMLATSSLPVDECNEMLSGIIEEEPSRRDGPEGGSARLLLYGSQIDNIALIRLLEESGANVVAEDICMGSKYFLQDVALDCDPLEALARRYLGQITCPRTFRVPSGTHKEDLEHRFGYIKDMAREYKVDGAVLYILMFCDCFEFDAPDVRAYLEGEGIPTLHLEDDYSLSGMSGLKTRIEAFLEMLSRPGDEVVKVRSTMACEKR